MTDDTFAVLLVTGVWSIWMTVLFVLLCKRVKAIKLILLAGFNLEEYEIQGEFKGGLAYRKATLREPKERMTGPGA